MPRVLSPQEVAQLGLDAPAAASPAGSSAPRPLSPEEVAQLGLNDSGPSEQESALRGGAQGLTFGTADELAGGAEALWDKLKGAHEALGELYLKHRNESRANFKKAEEANPHHYGLGKLAGGIAGQVGLAALTGGTSIPEQVALGAAGGGLQAMGDSESLDANAVGDIAKGVVGGGLGGGIGAGAGALAGKAINAVGSKVVPGLAKKLDDVAIAQGRRAITAGAESLSSKAPVSDAAVRTAFEEGAIPWVGTTEKISNNLEALRSKYGAQYATMLKRLEERGVTGPDAQNMAYQLLQKAELSKANTLGSPVPGLYEKQALELAEKNPGHLPLSEAENIKRDLQTQARYGEFKDTPLNDAKMDIASDMRQAIEDKVHQAGANATEFLDSIPEHATAGQLQHAKEVESLAAHFKPTKQKLGDIIEASDAASKGAAQAARRNKFSLRDTAMAAASTASHGLGAGALTGTATNVARTYGNTAVARGAYTLSKALGKVGQVALTNPARLGKFGSILGAAAAKGQSNLAATHYALAQTDPDYQKLTADLDDEPDHQP